MTTRPHDVGDLYLAPVVLHLDHRLDELAPLSGDELVYRVALETNRDPRTPAERATAMLEAVTYLIETHGWKVDWCPRGLRVTHDDHELVLGVPPNVRAYLDS